MGEPYPPDATRNKTRTLIMPSSTGSIQVNTIFGPNDISLVNIVVDQYDNFTGFNSLRCAGFVPRNWISIGMLDAEVLEAEHLRMWNSAVLRAGNCKVRKDTRNSISYI